MTEVEKMFENAGLSDRPVKVTPKNSSGIEVLGLMYDEKTNSAYYSIGEDMFAKMLIDEDYKYEILEKIRLNISEETANRSAAPSAIDPLAAEAESQIITYPNGEKVLMVTTAFGVRYLKLTKANPLEATGQSGIKLAEEALDKGYDIRDITAK